MLDGAGAEYVSPLATLRLPDGWKQVESGVEDTLIFTSESGREQIVVVVEKLPRQRRGNG
ncbi:hypothetical protein Oter_2536 [Opitutus terrae PB90-1]|uniref:Uncharacterized protein n=1 Tax=Opitutus terrae (strain DSM 11246 / JCM 15787 / PB90-1) TaxID=452637 RepID=B1ZT29_OPITP|nr:hypothetical protein Oter_2536 [Opitutus terrae PB90-1]